MDLAIYIFDENNARLHVAVQDARSLAKTRGSILPWAVSAITLLAELGCADASRRRAGPIHARTFTGTSGSYVSPHLDATCRGRRREVLSESRMRYVASAFMWRLAPLVPSSAAN